MEITIDEHSGFCFGVINAIQAAEKELEAGGGKLYCLGDIVHNSEEVKRLSEKGLVIINYEEFLELRDCKVLIRAHGEPPQTYQLAKERNITLIDASCPVVLKLQQSILKGYEEAKQHNGQIVIYGKNGHAEVNGLVGQTDNNAIVVEEPADIDKIDFSRPIHLYSQTTQSTEGFQRLIETIKSRTALLQWTDSICKNVANRLPNLKAFARQHDTVLFVSGKNSSNGKFLYETCKAENPHTYLLSAVEEVTPDMLHGDRIGICGATSTPRWLMLKLAHHLETLKEPSSVL